MLFRFPRTLQHHLSPCSFRLPQACLFSDVTSLKSNLFRDQENINPLTRKALAVLLDPSAQMTDIQEKTLLPGLKGDDILARARTGTGKTIAFLVPALQNISLKKERGKIEVLCVSPTRELATQIATQAVKLLRFHPGRPKVQTLYGGKVKPEKDANIFRENQPSVVVATPGRLLQHLRDNSLGHQVLAKLSVLVLDEADQLLEQGFRKEVMELINSHIPGTAKGSKSGARRPQTLLSSATVPAQMKEVMALAMRPDYVTVDCISASATGAGGGQGRGG